MKNTSEIISYASIAVIAISLFFIGTELTGLAVTDNETGLVNVTIETSAALDFTTPLLDFGAGSVTGGAAGATIDSEGTMTDGTGWTSAGALILENIGNTNVTLNLTSNKTADDFIGGNSPTFKAKVIDNEGDACSGATQSFASYADINLGQQIACSNFAYDDALDTVAIEFELYIPNNALGAKTVEIIAIGEYTP